MNSAVLFYAPDATPDLLLHKQTLAAHGYRLRHCPDTAALRFNLRRELQQASQTGDPVLAVLASSIALNRSAAAILAATPQVGVLAQIDACDDATLASTLQLGADAWCPRTCSPDILAMSLHGLKRRLEHNVPALGNVTPYQPPSPQGSFSIGSGPLPWALKDGGWVIETPVGMTLRLTSAERQFMLCLTRQPDKTASHAQLLTAMGQNGSDRRAAKSRLGVMVSRLRRKVAGCGLELPVQSVHGRGYVLTADLKL